MVTLSLVVYRFGPGVIAHNIGPNSAYEVPRTMVILSASQMPASLFRIASRQNLIFSSSLMVESDGGEIMRDTYGSKVRAPRYSLVQPTASTSSLNELGP